MTGVPRVVVATRRSEYDTLIAEHGTHEQARFFLASRGQSIEPLEEEHRRFHQALTGVLAAIPLQWRRAKILREDLSRFLFEPGDVVVVLGQDGLVANVAKYLTGQPVIGLNPNPQRYDGILVPHPPAAAPDLLVRAARGNVDLEHRTMVEAELDDGQRLLCLNEVFVGHRSHQSARYLLRWRGQAERQSSSGVIVATGTGATGWARSISCERQTWIELPAPTDASLVFFVREAFPSVATGTELTEGLLSEGEPLEVVSQMNADGVLFGDGIEDDYLKFDWGRRATVRVTPARLCLVRG